MVKQSGKDIAQVRNDQLIGFLQAKLAVILGVLAILASLKSTTDPFSIFGISLPILEWFSIGLIPIVYLLWQAKNDGDDILDSMGYKNPTYLDKLSMASKKIGMWKKLMNHIHTKASDNAGLEKFKNELHFLEVLLLISTLLVAILQRSPSFLVLLGNFVFILFIVSSIAFYAVVAFEMYKGNKYFKNLPLVVAGTFSASVGLSIIAYLVQTEPLTSFRMILTAIIALLYWIVTTAMVYFVLIKPINTGRP